MKNSFFASLMAGLMVALTASLVISILFSVFYARDFNELSFGDYLFPIYILPRMDVQHFYTTAILL